MARRLRSYSVGPLTEALANLEIPDRLTVLKAVEADRSGRKKSGALETRLEAARQKIGKAFAGCSAGGFEEIKEAYESHGLNTPPA